MTFFKTEIETNLCETMWPLSDKCLNSNFRFSNVGSRKRAQVLSGASPRRCLFRHSLVGRGPQVRAAEVYLNACLRKFWFYQIFELKFWKETEQERKDEEMEAVANDLVASLLPPPSPSDQSVRINTHDPTNDSKQSNASGASSSSIESGKIVNRHNDMQRKERDWKNHNAFFSSEF